MSREISLFYKKKIKIKNYKVHISFNTVKDTFVYGVRIKDFYDILTELSKNV